MFRGILTVFLRVVLSYSQRLGPLAVFMCFHVWPVATYGCECWTLTKNEETRLDAFEMNGLRKILRVSWTAKPGWISSRRGQDSP